MDQLHPPFFVEILEFHGTSSVSKGRLAEPSERLEEAERRGEREVSTANLPPGSLGFRILDDEGREVFRWRRERAVRCQNKGTHGA